MTPLDERNPSLCDESSDVSDVDAEVLGNLTDGHEDG